MYQRVKYREYCIAAGVGWASLVTIVITEHVHYYCMYQRVKYREYCIAAGVGGLH